MNIRKQTPEEVRLETKIREIFGANISANERVGELMELMNSSELGRKIVNKAIISYLNDFGSDSDDIILIWGLRISCSQSKEILATCEQCNGSCGYCSKRGNGAKNIVQIGEMSGVDKLFEERGGADI